MKMSQFLQATGIKMTATEVAGRPDNLMTDSATHYKCRITHGRFGFNLHFSQGAAHTQPPTVDAVLDCLAADAAGYENTVGFEDWAAEYGYDTDSRSAEKIYRVVKRQAEQLKRTLGSELYEQLLWKVERD